MGGVEKHCGELGEAVGCRVLRVGGDLEGFGEP